MTHSDLVQADGVSLLVPGGQVILRDVTLHVRGGEFVAIVGPSGCGKTTLLRILAGLIAPTSGTRSAPNDIAYVFQEPVLLEWRTVWENVRLPLELAGVAQSEQRDRIAETLELVALVGDARKYPRELSGGMRMRVSLARALVTRPRLLLFDEPFAALDDLLRQQLNEELLRLREQYRWAAVFVTHNLAEAVFLSQRVVVMTAGSIANVVEIPLQYPRDRLLRADPQYVRLVEQVFASLRRDEP